MREAAPLQLDLEFDDEQANVTPRLHLAPNPDFGRLCNTDWPAKKVDDPYSQAITAGKNSYVYDAHTYHTKVPPQGIEPLIAYYTSPGDVILDPFCGSGMTGVAASGIGRKALLSDLSPAATFIAYNLNTPIDSSRYLNAVRSLLSATCGLESRLYHTYCRECGKHVVSLYTVWSYGLLCNHCGHEFILWDVARDEREQVRESKIISQFDCPHCRKAVRKSHLRKTRRYPVAIGYKCCGSKLKETIVSLDDYDRSALHKIDNQPLPEGLWYPTNRFPEGVNTRQAIAAGIDTVDKAYTPRGLWAMAHLWDLASKWPEEDVRTKLLFTLTSLYQRVSVFSEFRFWGGSGNTANYNVPAIMNEQNVFRVFARKANTISWYFKDATSSPRHIEVSNQSALHLAQIPDQSVDYVFTDPPFGSNINYSEMNFLWESWLGVYTDNTEEAIVNKVQNKGIVEYQQLLTKAILEVRRVLKDRAWLTIVFHNSSDKIWASLQNAIRDGGFQVRGTQTFDKKHGTFKQFVSDNAVGYDLVLHCQKTEASPVIEVHNHSETTTRVRIFVTEALEYHRDDYQVQYLHVARADEFDYRKLYANWLSVSLRDSFVGMGFDEFRALVRSILQTGNAADAT